MVFGGHEEVARLGRVMRRLLGNVVTLGAVWVVPVASEDLAEDWVEWFLYAPTLTSVAACGLMRICRSSYGGLMCHPLR